MPSVKARILDFVFREDRVEAVLKVEVGSRSEVVGLPLRTGAENFEETITEMERNIMGLLEAKALEVKRIRLDPAKWREKLQAYVGKVYEVD